MARETFTMSEAQLRRAIPDTPLAELLADEGADDPALGQYQSLAALLGEEPMVTAEAKPETETQPAPKPIAEELKVPEPDKNMAGKPQIIPPAAPIPRPNEISSVDEFGNLRKSDPSKGIYYSSNYDPHKAGVLRTVVSTAEADAAFLKNLPNTVPAPDKERIFRWVQDPTMADGGTINELEVEDVSNAGAGLYAFKPKDPSKLSDHNAVAMGHSHPQNFEVTPGTMKRQRVANIVPGPRDDGFVRHPDSLVPNVILHTGRALAVEMFEGQLRARIIGDGTLSSAEEEELQERLDEWQTRPTY